MGWKLFVAGLVALLVAVLAETSLFQNWIAVNRSEDRLVRQTMIYAHQVAYDNINHFGFLIRDNSPGGTLKPIPGVGTKRFGIKWTPRGEKEHAELLFRFCDPRFPSGKSPIYGLEDVEWGICRREGTVMTAQVKFLEWEDSDHVKAQIAVTFRDLREKEKVWKTKTKEVSFPVPSHG